MLARASSQKRLPINTVYQRYLLGYSDIAVLTRSLQTPERGDKRRAPLTCERVICEGSQEDQSTVIQQDLHRFYDALPRVIGTLHYPGANDKHGLS